MTQYNIDEKQVVSANAGPELLTDAKMAELFGDDFPHLAYINFDNNSCNCKMYNGCELSNIENTLKKAQKFKQELEKHSEILQASRQVTMVAMAAMTVKSSEHQRKQWGRLISQPKYDPKGSAIVCMVVTRDIETGKINPLSLYWLGGMDFGGIESNVHANIAARNILENFASDGANNTKFLEKVVQLVKLQNPVFSNPTKQKGAMMPLDNLKSKLKEFYAAKDKLVKFGTSAALVAFIIWASCNCTGSNNAAQEKEDIRRKYADSLNRERMDREALRKNINAVIKSSNDKDSLIMNLRDSLVSAAVLLNATKDSLADCQKQASRCKNEKKNVAPKPAPKPKKVPAKNTKPAKKAKPVKVAPAPQPKPTVKPHQDRPVVIDTSKLYQAHENKPIVIDHPPVYKTKQDEPVVIDTSKLYQAHENKPIVIDHPPVYKTKQDEPVVVEPRTTPTININVNQGAVNTTVNVNNGSVNNYYNCAPVTTNGGNNDTPQQEAQPVQQYQQCRGVIETAVVKSRIRTRR